MYCVDLLQKALGWGGGGHLMGHMLWMFENKKTEAYERIHVNYVLQIEAKRCAKIF